VGIAVSGSINWELSHGGNFDPFFESALLNTYVKMPERDNNGTADSAITDVSATSDTYTVNAGSSFVEGHLVRGSGFTGGENNTLFRAQTGSSDTAVVAPASPGLADETAPPGTARLKVVGFEGASGDITADATGLTSTTLDFTTLGLTVGQWLKVGGTAAVNKFDTAALNTFVRVKTVAANDLDFDYLPTGWATDAGSGKTIRVFTSDYLEVGDSLKSITLEKVFTGQGTPFYINYVGAVMNGLTVQADAQSRLTGSFDTIGFTGGGDTTALDASPDAASTSLIMNTSTNIGRLLENGADQASPVWIESAGLTLNNNITPVGS